MGVRLKGLRFGFSDSDVVFTGKRGRPLRGGPCFPMLRASLSANLHNMARRRRRTPLLPPPSIAQVRRDNAILLGAGTLIILAGLLVGAGLAWWAL